MRMGLDGSCKPDGRMGLSTRYLGGTANASVCHRARRLAALAAAGACRLVDVRRSPRPRMTMSSWVPPSHLADQGRAGRLGPAGREGHQRPRQVADAAEASVGASGHLRRRQGRPGRRVLRDRQLHAGPPRAAAAARAAGRRRHRRDQLGRLLAHPLEVFARRSASTRASSCSASSRTGRARCSTPSGRSPRSRTSPA